MLNLTQTPFGAAKAAAKYIDSKTAQAFSRLDKATESVKRELAELERKHTPKLGTVAKTIMESEVRAYLRSLPEHQLAGKLGEAAMVGDAVSNSEFLGMFWQKGNRSRFLRFGEQSLLVQHRGKV